MPIAPIDPHSSYEFWPCALRSAQTFVFFLGLDLMFWFFADFSKFAPPSSGTVVERLGMVLLTSAGPAGWMLPRCSIAWGIAWLSLGSLLPIVLGAIAGRGCFSLPARIAGFTGWFGLGFLTAAHRIT